MIPSVKSTPNCVFSFSILLFFSARRKGRNRPRQTACLSEAVFEAQIGKFLLLIQIFYPLCPQQDGIDNSACSAQGAFCELLTFRTEKGIIPSCG
jgi:hypothetical protein